MPNHVSILFLSATDDTLIDKYHPTVLYNTFDGHKKIHYFKGNHNSRRPPDIHNLITQFFLEKLAQTPTVVCKQAKKVVRVPSQKIKPKSPPSLELENMLIEEEPKKKNVQNTFVETIKNK